MLSIKVPFSGPLHAKLLQAVKERKDFSDRKMKEFHKQWDDADNSMRAYIKEREIDKKRKDKKTFEGTTDYVTLEVPYVYAVIMTAHTYYSSVFLSRTPVWQFTGRHGEAQNSIMAVEAVMDYQLRVGNQLPVMYNWIYDLAKYSLGIVGNYWDSEEKIVTNFVNEPIQLMGVTFPGTRRVKKEEILPGYRGNKLFNVRPYDFYPDPRVPIWKFQEGEFVIRETSEGYHSIVSTEHTYPGYYINLKEMGVAMRNKSNDRTQGSAQVNLPLQPGEGTAPGPGFVKISDAYIRLIPSVWGLGDSKRVEIWCFQIAEDAVVISAKPLGLYHNQFPFTVMEGNFGSEEFAKFGMLEIIRPLTDIMTWLFNSHFYNVRRVLNNQVIVDPSRVVMKDVTKPGQRVIRLKPQAYGTDVRQALYQLQHVDVTQGHLTNISVVEQMIQRCSSVVDNVMGVPNTGGRKTATEVRSATGWSTGRLRTPVEYNSALAMDPLSRMMISNTQQFMDFEQKYSIAGNTLEMAQSFVNVDSRSIAGEYNFVPVDGAMPIDRLAQANFWKEMLMQMARVPKLAAQWDIGSMIAHAMKMQGERNVDRFRINVMAPGTDVQGQVQQGNMVPVGAKGGSGRAPGANTPGTSGGNV